MRVLKTAYLSSDLSSNRADSSITSNATPLANSSIISGSQRLSFLARSLLFSTSDIQLLSFDLTLPASNIQAFSLNHPGSSPDEDIPLTPALCGRVRTGPPIPHSSGLRPGADDQLALLFLIAHLWFFAVNEYK